MLCTGYKHHFPFLLPDELRLKTNNRLYPLGLYKGIVWEDNPKLSYIGMQDQYYTFNMFDAQAWYARDVIMGRIALPSPEAMAADIKAWRAREEVLENPFQAIDYQTDYVRDCWPRPTTRSSTSTTVAELFKEWEHHKVEGILTYRDRAYPSTITGTMSPAHHTPWLEALDDSLPTFLNAPAGAA